jgi:hypothetical protein
MEPVQDECKLRLSDHGSADWIEHLLDNMICVR